MKWLSNLRKLFNNIKAELKKVHWPDRRQVTLFSSIVIVTILVVGAFFWLLDTGFTAVLRAILQ
ncbi:MAG: preprotein translocase subunit SecE [Firmicutes bacterium]|nr:preprotein translocase subunit SecE [Bacillota bacterium]